MSTLWMKLTITTHLTYHTPPLFMVMHTVLPTLTEQFLRFQLPGGCHFQLQAGSAMNLQPIDLIDILCADVAFNLLLVGQ